MSETDNVIIDHRTKGVPGLAAPFRIGEISAKGWNAMRGDMPLPLAVIKEPVLAENARWISAFAARAGVSLCPHGKTTMSPEIFRRQLADGAWGITLSTAHQVQVARDFGVPRILLANQLIGPAFIDYIAAELERDPEFDFYCLVDSLEGVEMLRSRLSSRSPSRSLQVLLEIGMDGGRTGCRSREQALAVARAVHGAAPYLLLRGVEGFEGIVPETTRDQPAPVEHFLDRMDKIAAEFAREGIFAPGEVILSAGGSAYFDIVARKLAAVDIGRPVRIVLRSGCYIAHDSDMYVSHFAAIERRSDLARAIPGRLAPALEVLAYVQSRPESTRVLLTAGKRDCSFDHNLPTPLATVRPGQDPTPRALGADHKIVSLNDQHAYMELPARSDIAVGDIVILGISHPCTTFDRWDVLYGVNSRYDVISAFKTYF